MLRVNTLGVMTLTALAAAEMRNGGSIVNIASIEGLQPAMNHSHYTTSKAAVLMHTKSAALELGYLGIRVNAVAPGLIDREGLETDWPEGVHAGVLSVHSSVWAHPKMWRTPCCFCSRPPHDGSLARHWLLMVAC